tara:strand:- start:270 stop:608 length:339 start_codon:yes stop_codon:yes gene_type:complete
MCPNLLGHIAKDFFMQKLILLLFITSLINVSHAGYLDDWSNDDLCGWMDSPSIPKYIFDEVDKREILCSGGLEVSTLPESDSSVGENGTNFPSPDPSLIPKAIPDKKSDYSY